MAAAAALYLGGRSGIYSYSSTQGHIYILCSLTEGQKFYARQRSRRRSMRFRTSNVSLQDDLCVSQLLFAMHVYYFQLRNVLLLYHPLMRFVRCVCCFVRSARLSLSVAIRQMPRKIYDSGTPNIAYSVSETELASSAFPVNAKKR